MHPHRSHWIPHLRPCSPWAYRGSRIRPGRQPVAERRRRAATGIHRPPRARLSLIAIVIGGLMFAFGEGGSKKALAGIIFGLGMAMGAANFLTWLFT